MDTTQKPSPLSPGREVRSTDASELHVKVRFIMHVDEKVIPREIEVNCPEGATVQDLINILSDAYGESLRSALHQRNLMATVNGISKGRSFRNVVLGAAGEKDIEIVFMIYMDHGG
jgi:hypothetical protein